MIAHLVNHLWQSTGFAAAAALLAWLLRDNRAHVRYWLWFSASLKFLVPFSLLVSLGSAFSILPPVRQHPAPPVPVVSLAVEPFTAAVTSGEAIPPTASPAPASWAWLIVAIWTSGFVSVALMRVRGWRQIRAAVAASVPVATALDERRIPIRSSPALLEPGVVGVWRPVLLLPADIAEQLTPPQLAAVIEHEHCHIRRRDNLTAAVHMAVEAIFWFHPLVWWIGTRLVNERERACDEAVLGLGAEPREYAQGILNVCKRYVESPLACVSGISGPASPKPFSRVGGGSNLAARIEAIVSHRIGLELTAGRTAILVLSAITALVVPVAAGSLKPSLPDAAAASQRDGPRTSELPQKFEVASIRPCAPEPPVPGARSGGGNGSFSPGRAYLSCFVVRNLIDTAYVGNRNGRKPGDALDNWPGRLGGQVEGGPQRIRGGPSWVYSDKYTIEAKADGFDPSDARNPDRSTMLGPMLRALLEERFQLKMHQETEDAPMYALVVAKGGLKVKPMEEGACTTDRSNGPITLSEAKSRGVKPTCGTVLGGPDGSNWRYQHGGQTLAVIAGVLSSDLGVKVVDRTGVTDVFNITWEYGPDESTPGVARYFAATGTEPPPPPTAPSVFTALQQQLGLTLEKIKGSRAFIVIDRIERPTADGPAEPPARASGAGRRGGPR